MGLKQDIVIKNEFTNLSNPSRGKTIDAYVMKYCNRSDAIQSITPIIDDDNYVDEGLSNQLAEKIDHISDNHRFDISSPKYDNDLTMIMNHQGVAFNQNSLSVSKSQLIDDANNVQRLFNENHTIMKTVLSFKTDYLKRQNAINPNASIDQYGFMFDNVDDLKLRTAIQRGLKEYTKAAGFTNPKWVGAYQMDTLHLHVHLVIADDVPFNQSQRLKTYDSVKQERGKINKKEAAILRENVNNELSLLKPYHQINRQRDVTRLRANVQQQRTNFMQQNNQLLLQNILVNMDNDRRRKDAYNNYRNFIANNYIDEPNNRNIYQPVLNDLSHNETRNIEQNINPFLLQLRLSNDVKSRFANANDKTITKNAIMNNHRSTLLDRHLRKFNEFANLLDNYDTQLNLNQTDQSSFVMRDYYDTELLYHANVVDKYRYFNRFNMRQIWQNNAQQFLQQYDQLNQQRLNLINKFNAAGVYHQVANTDRLLEMLENEETISPKTVKKTLAQLNSGLTPSYNENSEIERNISGDVLNVHRKLTANARYNLNNTSLDLRNDYANYNHMKNEYVTRLFNFGLIDAKSLITDLDNSTNVANLAPLPQAKDPLLVIDDQRFNETKGFNLQEESSINSYRIQTNELDSNILNLFTHTHQLRNNAVYNASQYLSQTNQTLPQINQTTDDLNRMQTIIDWFNSDTKVRNHSYNLSQTDIEEYNDEIRELNATIPQITTQDATMLAKEHSVQLAGNTNDGSLEL